MLRVIIYIVLTFIIFTVLKLFLNIFRKRTPINTPSQNPKITKESEKLDKSKIVDADFEEIK